MYKYMLERSSSIADPHPANPATYILAHHLCTYIRQQQTWSCIISVSLFPFCPSIIVDVVEPCRLGYDRYNVGTMRRFDTACITKDCPASLSSAIVNTDIYAVLADWEHREIALQKLTASCLIGRLW